MPKLPPPPLSLTPSTSYPSSSDGRDERLAVNLWDLDRLDPTTRARLLGGRVDASQEIDLRGNDKKSTEVAVELTCQLLEAAMVCDAIRAADKRFGDRPTRVYVKRRTWVKVPGDVFLSVSDGRGGFRLNPELFPPALSSTPGLAPPVRRVALGNKRR